MQHVRDLSFMWVFLEPRDRVAFFHLKGGLFCLTGCDPSAGLENRRCLYFACFDFVCLAVFTLAREPLLVQGKPLIPGVLVTTSSFCSSWCGACAEHCLDLTFDTDLCDLEFGPSERFILDLLLGDRAFALLCIPYSLEIGRLHYCASPTPWSSG